ncbi:MAG: sirohydrochlorin chelatase [Bacilli bacterium]
MEKKVILFTGHGSKEPNANEWFELLATNIAHQFQSGTPAIAYLESGTPSIATKIEELGSQGVSHITIAPLFLTSGAHVIRDIPKIIEEMGSKFTEITFSMTPPLGAKQSVVDAMIASLQRMGFNHDEDSEIIVVFHGSRMQQANTEIQDLIKMMRKQLPKATVRDAHLKFNTPKLQSLLETKKSVKTYVIPHLLFDGEHLRAIKKAIAEVSQFDIILCDAIAKNDDFVQVFRTHLNDNF